MKENFKLTTIVTVYLYAKNVMEFFETIVD